LDPEMAKTLSAAGWGCQVQLHPRRDRSAAGEERPILAPSGRPITGSRMRKPFRTGLKDDWRGRSAAGSMDWSGGARRLGVAEESVK
jgi:hypothetical protein